MKSLLRSSVVIIVCAIVTSCDQMSPRRHAPGIPTAPAPSPAPAPGGESVRIVSGADLAPVAGAVVHIEGDTTVSNANGDVMGGYFGAPVGGEIDVDAPGFLPRKTRIDNSRRIVLWPIGNEAEADAVRAMVYGRGSRYGEVLHPVSPGEFYVTLQDQRAEVFLAWELGASAFGALFELSYRVMGSFQYEQNEIAVAFSPTLGCTPVGVWGFCQDLGSPYKVFTVLPAQALDPMTIRRVLASLFLGPNPLPGFMNATTPADALSALELQTIRMILQRPAQNRWPDTDR